MYDTPFRSYDAQLGRFHQIDPLADQAPGINPYRFGFNNPISLNDPTGLYEGSIWDLVNDLWNRTEGDVGVFRNDGGIFEQDFDAQDEINFVVDWLDEWASDGGGASSLGLIDLAKGNSGQLIADYLRSFALAKRANPYLKRPYLHDFIDVLTKFTEIGDKTSFKGFGSLIKGQRMINGESFEVKISLHNIGLSDTYNPNTTDNRIGSYRIGYSKKRNNYIEYITGYNNGDGKGLISFIIVNNSVARDALYKYIIGG